MPSQRFCPVAAREKTSLLDGFSYFILVAARGCPNWVWLCEVHKVWVEKSKRQAGAELCHAEIKLEVIADVIKEAWS